MIKRSVSDACCGKKSIHLELDFPIMKDLIDVFMENKYITNSSYLQSGFFYIENNNLIGVCPFGSNKIQIKCKNTLCNEEIDNIENIINNYVVKHSQKTSK